MASCAFSDGCQNNNFSLLIRFVEIFATKQFAARFELPWVSVKRFLGRAVRSETAPSRKIVKVLEAKMARRKKKTLS